MMVFKKRVNGCIKMAENIFNEHQLVLQALQRSARLSSRKIPIF